MIGTIGSRGFFLLRDHAPCVGLVFVLLPPAGGARVRSCSVSRPKSVKDVKTKSGMARHNPIGGNFLGKKVDKARMTSGAVQSLKANGNRSLSKLMPWGPL